MISLETGHLEQHDGIQMWRRAGRASRQRCRSRLVTEHRTYTAAVEQNQDRNDISEMTESQPGDSNQLTLAKHFKEFGVKTASGEQCAIRTAFLESSQPLVEIYS
jgi:hypothetical protein